MLEAELSSAAAGRTRSSRLTGRDSTAVTCVAALLPAELDLRLFSEDRFLKLKREIGAQVRSALRARATLTGARSHAEQIAEDVSEDVAEISGGKWIESSGARVAHCCMSEAIVSCALLRIAQYAVGLARFLELLFRFRIVWVSVRVILQRELAIR